MILVLKSPCTIISPSLAEPPTPHLLFSNLPSSFKSLFVPTNPDFGYEMDNDEEQVTLDKDKQNLRVSIDKKNRGGKVVTLITGFVGTDNERKRGAVCLFYTNL